MMRKALIAFSASLLLALAGCDKIPLPPSSNASGGASAPALAVLDLGAVAKALGRDEVFKEQVEAAGRQLQQQLTEFTTELQEQLRAEQEKLGEAPSDEDQLQLRQKVADAQRQVQQSQAIARQKAREFQLKLANEFRDEVQPVAAEVARERGASAILIANTLMWFEPTVDITGDVIDAMRARGAASGAPSIPPAGSGTSQ